MDGDRNDQGEEYEIHCVRELRTNRPFRMWESLSFPTVWWLCPRDIPHAESIHLVHHIMQNLQPEADPLSKSPHKQERHSLVNSDFQGKKGWFPTTTLENSHHTEARDNPTAVSLP